MRDRLIAAGKAAKDDIELFAGRVGSFEITVDGDLRYSKLKTRRFPQEAEIDGLVSIRPR